MRIKQSMLICFEIALVLITIGTASAATFTVNDSTGPVANFTSVQFAINNATVTEGDTILVYPGTYNENVNVTKQLNITSTGGAAVTHVTAFSSDEHVFNVTADRVTISGFNVSGATATDSGKAGIILYNSSNSRLSNNIASANIYGIILYNSSNSRLSNNIASANIYNIYLNNSDYNTLINNTASNSIIGESIYLYYSDYNTLTNTTVVNNNEDGIYLSNSDYNTLANNTVSNNALIGIYMIASSNNALTSNTASNNAWTGILLDSFSNYNTLANNIVSNNVEDGIGMEQSSNNNLVSNTMSINTGSGIDLDDSDHNTLTSNMVLSNANVGIELDYSDHNLIYNNYFDNTVNTEFTNINSENTWNITMTVGTNIVGGPLLGGNYWSHPDGTGFSQTHVDADKDGICDEQYNITDPVSDIDYLPLSIVVDNLTPVISITSPADGSSTTASSIVVSGLVNGTGSLPVVTVNNIVAGTTILNFSGTFTATVPLVMGVNTISADVTDSAGNTDTTFISITRTSTSSGGSSGGVGTPVIVPVQEEPEEKEEETDTSNSDGVGNATILIPEEEPEEEVVEEPSESQNESNSAPGFSTMLTTGILLSAYIIYRRKD